jgi:hypothetical protein
VTWASIKLASYRTSCFAAIWQLWRTCVCEILMWCFSNHISCRYFQDNLLTAVPAGFFDETPNLIQLFVFLIYWRLWRKFRFFSNNLISSLPDGLFLSSTSLSLLFVSFPWQFDFLIIDFCRTFANNGLTDLPSGLFPSHSSLEFLYARLAQSLDILIACQRPVGQHHWRISRWNFWCAPESQAAVCFGGIYAFISESSLTILRNVTSFHFRRKITKAPEVMVRSSRISFGPPQSSLYFALSSYLCFFCFLCSSAHRISCLLWRARFTHRIYRNYTFIVGIDHDL